ncbi:crotonase/enoyl-CoA hydratase family protein [Ruegeria sp. HKCCD6604]|uniref:crotonase/enoyl-CoA hydratase family protein n=1 Tax=Ruegeria sp. HKCCD6604 TaxID=2683000 RepID=UPI0014909979|nr:crotonase/enoyl-CoA hydratase family protein [Ruegeria sp. HKCCD6604]NOC93390.1 crotonase/enoyl-CoA hydratase family protein [Ruegeria sp. HKCCD6604]
MPVSIEKSEDVWTVIHDRPDARNAVDTKHAEALVEAFLSFEASSAKAAVFWGKGGNFCAGWDLKLAASLADPERREAYFDKHGFPIGSAPSTLGPMGPSRLELSKPVIGAIEGAAVAGGMELALWCDIRVMAETSYLGVFCRRWGITLMDGGSVRLPRLVGQGKALEIALTGRKVEAEECYRIGLAEKVVPHGTARKAAEDMAHDIARFPQEAVRADRRSIIETRGMPVRDALKVEWANGLDAIRREGTAGAARFRDGAGRHGDFSNI